ncbi:hypothetical protein [Sphingopyxis sp. JAI128]|uniref:hypothetical protein n=1 Tax=Sphingopyxis sp. JAI128 TaxID=2723066 RepID=UPI001611AFFD|nr:hypothetical protein [Sphingopyxis sp. JAI128]MBB6424921.1 hypothetical protein [Sphingopyxis sp. JAI128]
MQTDPKLEMAREICAATYTKAAGRICSHTEHIEAKYRQGHLDGEMEVRAALAAIEECTERSANLADRWAATDFDESSTCMAYNIAHELRSGDHLKGPNDA